MNPSPHIIAICSISKADDEQNKCALTHDHLYITRKSKQYGFELDQITQTSFKQKKLLLPLVLGGVVGSLFLIAGFNFLVNIWVAMIVGLAGMLLFYYGWVGSHAIVIHTKIKEYDIFIDQVTTPLEAFFAMVNEYFILGKNKHLQYYLPLTKDAWQKASEIGHVAAPASGLRLYTDSNIVSQEMVFTINPTEAPNQISYQVEQSSNALVPYIFGQVDVKHIHLLNN